MDRSFCQRGSYLQVSVCMNATEQLFQLQRAIQTLLCLNTCSDSVMLEQAVLAGYVPNSILFIILHPGHILTDMEKVSILLQTCFVNN